MNRTISFILTLTLAFAILLTSCAAPAPVPPTASELLDIGERYLLELDYEQAVAQFLAVIEIEPMNARAYIGAAEAYVALGHTDDAIAVLERGLAATGDTEISAMLERLRNDDGADTADETPKTEDKLLPENIAAIIEQIKDALRAEDAQTASALLDNEEITEFIASENFSDYNAQLQRDGVSLHSYEDRNYVEFIDATRDENDLWANGTFYQLSPHVRGDPNDYNNMKHFGSLMAVSDIAGGKYTGEYRNTWYDLDWAAFISYLGTVTNGIFNGNVHYYEFGDVQTYIDGYSELDTERQNRWTVNGAAEGPNDLGE